MSGTSAALKAVEGEDVPGQRKRKRTIEDGRIITNVSPEFGSWIAREAEDLGVSGSTVARMLIVEAIKGRGWTKERLKTALDSGVDSNVDS